MANEYNPFWRTHTNRGLYGIIYTKKTIERLIVLRFSMDEDLLQVLYRQNVYRYFMNEEPSHISLWVGKL